MTLTVVPSFAQQAEPPASQTPPASQPAVPQAAPNTAPVAAASKAPDYPDPRTVVFGVYGLYSVAGNPNIIGGVAATNAATYESLYGIGPSYRIVPQFEAGMPITRTGMLYVDFERFHGWANQTLTRASYIDDYSFNPADQISSTYHVITMRIYLDDLLFPEKFPVPRLRFHSIWGLRYISLTDTVDSPTEDAVAGLPGSSFQLGTNYIMLPEFGLAMEYAVTKHVLFRVDGAGFGIPHHSDLDETSATLSMRKNNLEVLMGVKTLHFKTTPQKEEYEVGTFITPFIGLRWHF